MFLLNLLTPTRIETKRRIKLVSTDIQRQKHRLYKMTYAWERHNVMEIRRRTETCRHIDRHIHVVSCRVFWSEEHARKEAISVVTLQTRYWKCALLWQQTGVCLPAVQPACFTSRRNGNDVYVCVRASCFESISNFPDRRLSAFHHYLSTLLLGVDLNVLLNNLQIPAGEYQDCNKSQ